MARPESDPDIPAYVRELRMINGLLRAELAHTRRLALRLLMKPSMPTIAKGNFVSLVRPCLL